MVPDFGSAYAQPPLGLLSIAAYIQQQNDAKVSIVDANALKLSHEQIIYRLAQTDVVGVTCMTPHANKALNLVRDIKAAMPDLPIIVGGPHMTVVPEATMRVCPEIDYGVAGEGERTFSELLSMLEGGKTVEDIHGIWYRVNDQILHTAPREHIKDLNALPFPAYELLPKPIKKHYHPYPPHGRELPAMTMVTTRGCMGRCIFCSRNVWGQTYHMFSPEYVYNHVHYLIESLGVKYVQFYDDSFTLNKMRTLEICRLLEDIQVPWSCETRVNTVDEEVISAMSRAGCVLTGFGVESGSQRVLDVLQKDITLEQSAEAARLCDKYGIESVAYMMLGCPTETHEEILKSIRFVNSHPFDFVQWSVCTPYLGTELYNQAKTQGADLPETWDDWVYVNLGSVKREAPPMIATDLFTPEELQKLQVQGYKSFYIRPGYVWRRFKKSFTWSGLKTNLSGAKMLLEALA